MTPVTILLIVGVAIIAFVGGWFGRKIAGKRKLTDAEEMAERILADAEHDAEGLKKTRLLEVKDEWYKQKQTFKKETRQRKNELQQLEKRLYQREVNIDRKADFLKKKEQEFEQIEQNLTRRKHELEEKRKELEGLVQKENQKLEEVSGLTRDEAKQVLIDAMRKDAEAEAAQLIKEVEEQARLTAHREAKEVVIQAIQRAAVTHSVETTVSVVHLPSDEMKGRIIGREGRNIRSFEMETGIEVVIDDTPGAILLSGFDPVRREIAKIAMERLISDGRIHPGRIEDVVEKARVEFEERIQEIGEQTMMETGVHGLHLGLVRLLGKLKYRTTFGQNVLQHSIEVSHLTGLMAAQLGLDVHLAKRAGLLHDIGKASDNYTEGTLSEIGVDIARKYGEGPIVQNAISAFEDNVPVISPISILVQAADVISSSRPGARREILEKYIQRLEKIESIAREFEGVEKAYAIQAGREIRVIVEPEKISDATAEKLALAIAEKIQSEMEYPGQIKITVIREYRAENYAK